MGLWLAVPLYWIWVWAAYRQKKVYPLLFRFLEGYILAYLCFAFLPSALEGSLFWAGGGALIGIGVGAWTEGALRRRSKEPLWMTAVGFALLLLPWGMALSGIKGMAGGFGLYGAGIGILPEEENIKVRLRAAAGGSVGFLVGVAVFF